MLDWIKWLIKWWLSISDEHLLTSTITEEIETQKDEQKPVQLPYSLSLVKSAKIKHITLPASLITNQFDFISVICLKKFIENRGLDIEFVGLKHH